MANGNGNGNANINWRALGGLSIGGVASVVLAFSINTAKDAQIAISIAEQHGHELLILRSEINDLEAEMKERTKLRYNSEHAKEDLKYVRRDMSRLESMLKEHKREQHKK